MKSGWFFSLENRVIAWAPGSADHGWAKKFDGNLNVGENKMADWFSAWQRHRFCAKNKEEK